MPSISIIGVGRVGGALAIALSKENYKIKNLFVRDPLNAQKVVETLSSKPNILGAADFDKIAEDIVFIATQDEHISDIAGVVAKRLTKQGVVFLHTSGSLSSDVLDVLRQKGNKVGSIHPLVSVSDSFLGAQRFEDSYFCVEGDEKAAICAKRVVKDIKGISFSIETKYKTLYHASAVTACGHLVALVETATEMLSKTGLSSEEAKKVLMPLIESTVGNLKEQLTSDSLTGTFARADTGTLKKHIETLAENVSENELSIYLKLGKRSLEIARYQISEESKLAEMREIIALAERELRDKADV